MKRHVLLTCLADGERVLRGISFQHASTHPCFSPLPCRSWVFHRDCMFSRKRLLELLPPLAACSLRLKGIFRVAPATWVAVSAARAAAAAAAAAGTADAAGAAAETSSSAAAAVELTEIAYRRDSRAEVIVTAAGDGSSKGRLEEAAAGAGCSSSLVRQAAGLSIAEAEGGMEQEVAAAVHQAAAGDWAALEALLLATRALDLQP